MRTGWSGAIAAAFACALVCAPAIAGIPHDNHGGVLYLALAPELKYTDDGKYCGQSGLPRPSDAIVTGAPSKTPQIAFLLAAWPDTAHPELGAVTFGIRCSEGIRIRRWSLCANAVQAGTNDWPASGEGMIMAMSGHIDTTTVMELGCFIIDATKPGTLELVPHPNPLLAARFATVAPTEIPVSGLGALGFGKPGRIPTPTYTGLEMGAACAYDSLCAMVTESEAKFYGSKIIYFGAGVKCAFELCRPEAEIGACCLADGSCQVMTRKRCTLQGGRYQGDKSSCDPSPCGSSGGAGGKGKGR